MGDSVSERTLDLCVIGAGLGGFTTAALAAQLGARVTLIERGAFGGAVLESAIALRALAASASAAHDARRAGRFGIRTGSVTVDLDAVRAHVRAVVATTALNLSAERAGGLGVTVLKGTARFTGPDTVTVDSRPVRARRFVIAAGAQPIIPAIPGLDTVPYLTAHSAIALERLPHHLIVLGGEPAGIEIAQIYRRLGAQVTVIAANGILVREDVEAVNVVRTALRLDGVALLERAFIARVEGGADRLTVTVETDGEPHRIDGSHVLINAGRQPALTGLGLDAAKIATSEGGIIVDMGLRTSNARVYAIGDCVDGHGSAHAAADHAGAVVRNALFRIPTKASQIVPRVVFTAPELAHVGLTEHDARLTTPDLTVLRWPFAENDRARAEGETAGMIKILATRRGRLLGASIIGPWAGELIGVWALALRKGLRVRDIADTSIAYPTLAEVSGRVAQSALLLKMMSPLTRGLVRLIARFD
jgi:pyruvate/2-oxoglutarate dehydrogenase complex dihydrolipoamide dehydrogenase (E3) component